MDRVSYLDAPDELVAGLVHDDEARLKFSEQSVIAIIRVRADKHSHLWGY